jgi:hypothetical protein
VRRAVADVRALSGAAGLRYAEYRAAAGPAEAYALPDPTRSGAGMGRGAVGGRPPKASEAAKKYAKALGLASQR